MKLLKLGIGSIKKVVKNMILFEPVLEAKRKPTPSKPIKIKPNKDEMDYTDEVDNGDIDEANDDDNSEDNQDDYTDRIYVSAINAAKEKSENYHCRCPYFIKTEEKMEA
jgi:hypothetical protein